MRQSYSLVFTQSIAHRRRRPLEFEAGDHVFLIVTPTTGVGRALKARKLTPKFIGPYKITERIGKVAHYKKTSI
jgi:hypothetical protein